MGCGPISCCSKKDVGAPRPIAGDEKDEKSSASSSQREEKRQQVETKLQAVETEIRLSRSSSLKGDASSSKNEFGSRQMSWTSMMSNNTSRRASSGTISTDRRGSSGSVATMGTAAASVNSQLEFASPDQTIIIFDWDDTLCPSSWLRKKSQFDSSGNLKASFDSTTKAELQQLAEQVAPLIELAQALGKVIVVTNARHPWVDTSCKQFLPACKSIIKPIPVMYALEIMKDLDPEQFEADGGCVLTETKARAMKAAVSDFYSRYANQSWKNIISIGDAFFEHDAIRQVSRERPYQEMEAKKCRTKTVKLLEGPSIAGMVVQLSIIESWLTKIVQLDEDVDIDMSADENTVNAWVQQFGLDDRI